MALSYYSNWGDSFQFQQLDSAAINADDPELQALLHNTTDSFFNPDDFLCFDQNSNNNDNNNNSLLCDDLITNGVPPFDNNLNSLHQEIDFEPFHCYPKRQRCCDSDQIYSTFSAPNPCLAVAEDYSQLGIAAPSPFLVFPFEGYSNGSYSYENARKETTVAPAAVSLSAQSAAARQRRRRITEKTQELGKMVPGGQKMNTAEMLQSAYKYIKFLQAQVALLEFVGLSNQEVAEASFEGEELLESLLESPLIQEKLYSTENCLVPNKLVDEKAVKLDSNLFPALEKHH